FAAIFLSASPVRALFRPDSASTAGTPREENAPVVMMLFDELPLLSLLEHGEIDAGLYPNFAALAGEGTFFRNATSVAARTVHSVPAMLTGHLPRESLAPVNQQFPGNLFALLSSSHEVHAFESVTALCPSEVCTENQWGRTPKRALIADAARIWLARVWPTSAVPDAVGSWFRGGTITAPAGRLSPSDATFLLHRANDDQPVRFERFLASIDGSGTPFHFIHLVLPHAPYQFLPDGRRYPPQDLGLVSYEQRTPASWPALVNRQRHILQTMYVDRLLGQAVDRLKQVGLYDRAAIVVTTDHGISFAPGLELGTRNLRPENEHEVAWVPLIVKSPGQTTGEVRDDNVLSVDIAPTVADLAGVDIPWEVDGISLVSGWREDERKPWFNQPGAEMHIDVASSFPKVRAGVVSDLLMIENGPLGAFTLRRFGDVVGLPVNGLMTTDTPTGIAHLDRPEAFRGLDRQASVVPSLVTGHLELPAREPPPAAVAIALNGVVVGASELYEEGGKRYRFAAMVSPEYMNQGVQAVEVALLERERGTTILRPVRAAA
ncbi:MAG: sulfatase-like hydrolase/transferase, partial [Actinomycetota bacterium]|nr:sulfatase-like hydrolase/transferase [Actinomycetota bacterium]